MDWLFYAILAPIIYTTSNFVDKYLVEKTIKDYRGLIVFTGVAGFIAGTLLYIINGFPSLNLVDSLLTLLSGALLIWGVACYFRALTLGSTSEIVILMKLVPLATLILSIIFLQQYLTLSQLGGFLIILVSTTLLTLKIQANKFRISPTFFLMLLTSLLWSFSYVIFASVSESNSFSKTISYESWGGFLGTSILYFFSNSIRQGFWISCKAITKGGFLIIFINEGLFVTAKYFTFLAISLGPVALVSVLEGTQVFYAIIIGAALSLFNPKVFKEELDKNTIFKKITLASLIFLGIWLLK